MNTTDIFVGVARTDVEKNIKRCCMLCVVIQLPGKQGIIRQRKLAVEKKQRRSESKKKEELDYGRRTRPSEGSPRDVFGKGPMVTQIREHLLFIQDGQRWVVDVGAGGRLFHWWKIQSPCILFPNTSLLRTKNPYHFSKIFSVPMVVSTTAKGQLDCHATWNMLLPASRWRICSKSTGTAKRIPSRLVAAAWERVTSSSHQIPGAGSPCTKLNPTNLFELVIDEQFYVVLWVFFALRWKVCRLLEVGQGDDGFHQTIPVPNPDAGFKLSWCRYSDATRVHWSIQKFHLSLPLGPNIFRLSSLCWLQYSSSWDKSSRWEIVRDDSTGAETSHC